MMHGQKNIKANKVFKETEENWGGPKLGYYSGIFLEWLGKTTKIHSLNRGSGWRCGPRTTQIRIQACYHSSWPFWHASAYSIRVPLSHLPQTLFPKAMSLRRVTPAVGEGFTVHICIPDGTTAPPSWADPRHCVSNACEPFPDLVITWQTQAETFADDYDVCEVGGWGEKGLRMQHDPTWHMVLTSFLYLDLSCRMKQWGKAVRTYDRQSSGFHPISGRFLYISPFCTPNTISASGGVTFCVFG